MVDLHAGTDPGPLGRFDEARPYLDRMLQIDSDPNDITHHLASVAYVDLAWGEQDKDLANHHAERVIAMAVDSGSPMCASTPWLAGGLSHIIADRFEARPTTSRRRCLSRG
jgi:hypothetical protein